MIWIAGVKENFLGIPPPGGDILLYFLLDDSINPCPFLIWRFFISFCRIIRSFIRSSILNHRAFGLIFVCFNSCVCILVVSILESPPRCTICLVVLLCSSQNAMSEFADFFGSFRFHRSHCSGISVSMLGASIQTCASAFSRNLVILYLCSLRSPYNMLFRCLQHAPPHSMNVCAMLDLQYVLSG